MKPTGDTIDALFAARRVVHLKRDAAASPHENAGVVWEHDVRPTRQIAAERRRTVADIAFSSQLPFVFRRAQ